MMPQIKEIKKKEVDKQEVYEKAMAKWGYNAQIDMVVEEFSELIVAIQQDKRGRVEPKEIASEIADAEIMLEQLREIFVDEKLIDEIKQKKLERLQKRVNDEA